MQHLRAQDRAELRVAALAAAVIAAVTIADAADDRVVMVGLLIVAPLLCGLLGTPRAAAGAGLVAMAVAAASPAWNDTWGTWAYWVPLTVVTLGTIAATVTAALRARLATEARRMELLAEVAHVAEGRLDARATARAITSLVSGLVCDVAVIDLLDRDGVVHRVAAAMDGDRAELDAILARVPAPIPGRLQHFTTVGDELLGPIAGTAPDAAPARGPRLQSAVVVPLVARERTIGVLILGTCPGRPRLEAPDAEYFEVLAGRAALAIDNALLSRELTTTGGQLEAILSTVDAAVMVRDVDGELVYANHAAADLLRLPDADALRALDSAALMDRFDVYTEDGRPIGLDALPGSRLLAGDPAPPPLIVRSVVRATGEERWLLTKASSVTDVDGRVLMAVNLIEDITATKRSEVAQRLLAETARAVAEADDLDHTLQLVAEAAVPGLADWASVDLVDDRGRVMPVAIAHRDPDKIALGWELRTRWPTDVSQDEGMAGVVTTGTPWLLREVDDALLQRGARDAEHLATLRAVGMTSAMVVPIRAGARILGALSFVSSTARRFDARDLELATDLGHQAGVFINNAQLHAEQAHIASTLQAGLLPEALPAVDGWRLDVAYRAAGAANEVGGDFYDVVRFGDRWSAVVGDVVGKGAEAAVVTALARHTVAAIIESTGNPVHALTVLNQRLRERGTDFDGLCTIAIVTVDGDHASILSAGHPLPMLVRDGAARPVGTVSTMLGVLDDPVLRTAELTLEPGDQLVLYTDGVLDAIGEHERFGEERLRATLEALARTGAPEPIAAAVMGAVTAFAVAAQADDIAIVSLARAGAPAPA